MIPTHTVQFNIWLSHATGSQISTVPRHIALCRIPRQKLSFLPTFKLGRVENMTAAVIHFVRHLVIITLSQTPRKQFSCAMPSFKRGKNY